MSNPVAMVEIQAKSSGLAGQLREARARLGSFADGVSQKFRSMSGSLFSKGKGAFLGNMFQGVGQGVGQKLEGIVEGQAKAFIDYQHALTQFQISADKTPAEMDALTGSFRDLSAATSISPEELLRGTQILVDIGGAAFGTEQNLRTLARTTRATGADISDVATYMFSLQDAMHLAPGDLENVLSGVNTQAKAGHVHFKQLAEVMISLQPQYARFGVTGRKGAIELAAMLNITRTGFGTTQEAATGLEGIMKGIQRHAGLFHRGGVEIFNIGADGVRRPRELLAIVNDLAKSKIMKNPEVFIKDIGRGEGERALRLMVEHMSEFLKLVEAGNNETSIGSDLLKRNTSESGRLEIAMNNAKLAIFGAFTPERVDGFVTAIEKAGSAIGPLVDGVGKIGTVLGVLRGAGEKIHEAGGALFGGIDPDLMGLNGKAARDRALDEVKSQDAYAEITRGGTNGGYFDKVPRGADLAIAMRYHEALGPGAVAKRTAADQFLKEKGIMLPDQLANMIIRELQKISANTKAPTDVKIDSATAVKALKNSPAHARGTSK